MRTRRTIIELLESRRLLAAQIAGVVTDDLSGVSRTLGSTPLAGWTAYIDSDGDGMKEEGEPSAVSDLAGHYSIDDLVEGTYAVRLVAPDGWSAADGSGFGRTVVATDGETADASFVVQMTAPTVVDLMIVYTPAAEAKAGGMDAVREDIGQHVWDANRVYANSDTNVVLRPVYVDEVDYVESGDLQTDLTRMRVGDDGYMDDVQGIRDQVGADLVVLYEDRLSPFGEIGLGYMFVPGSPDASLGYSVVTQEDGSLPADQKYYVLAHEVAHNLGAGHDADHQPAIPGSPAYAHGFIAQTADGTVKDIMAYGLPSQNLPILSSPTFVYDGVAMGDAAGADNARVVRESGPTVAGYRTAPVETQPADPPPPVVDPPAPPVDPPVEPPVTPPVVVTPPPVEQPPVVEEPPVVVVPPVRTGIDLVTTWVPVPKGVVAGRVVALSARVANRGTKVFKGKVRVEFYLSRDRVLDAHDVLVKSVGAGVVKVGAGKFVMVSGKGTVGVSVPARKYYLIARVDPGNVIAEDKEGNNVTAGLAPFVVAAPPKGKVKVRRSVFSTLRIPGLPG